LARSLPSSAQGHDLTKRFPTIAAAVAKLSAKSVTLDGELVQADGRSRHRLLSSAREADP
jgi:ATP-dependent DNA ligase